MKIMKDFRNDLLKRREVKLLMEADKNPGIANASKDIAGQFKVNENVVVVRTVGSRFGRGTFLLDAFVYDSEADKVKTEPKKKAKKKEGEAAQAAPAPAGGKK